MASESKSSTACDTPLAKLEGRFIYIGVGPKTRLLDPGVAEDTIKGIIQSDFGNGHPIIFVVSGGGGEVPSTFAIADAIRMCRSPTITLAMGEVCSGHAHVFMAGQYRFMTPTSRIMFHNPATIARGSPEEVGSAAENLAWDRDVIIGDLLRETKLTKKQIVESLLSERYWSAKDAQRVGLCHRVVPSWRSVAKYINKGV